MVPSPHLPVTGMVTQSFPGRGLVCDVCDLYARGFRAAWTILVPFPRIIDESSQRSLWESFPPFTKKLERVPRSSIHDRGQG